jgi:DNA-binding NarL/FixJ family response regulator
MKKILSSSNHFAAARPTPTKTVSSTTASDHPFAETPSPSAGEGGPILTEKELRLLELLSYGYENGDIAKHFQTSLQAVKNMLRTINLKLGADNRTHAVAISFRNGWLPLKTSSPEA